MIALMWKTVRDHRTAALWVGVAMFLMALVDVLIYPEYSAQMQDFELPEYLEGFIGEAGDLASPAGFFAAEYFSWIVLLLVTVAIIGGTATLAGEERAGTLELLLAEPIARWRLVLAKAAGLTLVVTLAALAGLPGFVLGYAFVDVDLSLWRLAAATLYLLPVTLLFLMLALWLSAALPSRGAAAGVVIAVVVAAFFINTIGAAVDLLATPRKLSPFYWSDASRVLAHGFHDWGRSLVMLAGAALFLALAVRSFQRRDLSGGRAEWRWRRVTRSGERATGAPDDAERLAGRGGRPVTRSG